MTPDQRATRVRLREPNIEIAQSNEISAIRARDRDELVTLFSGEVWRFVSAQLRLREDAEDVMMETFAAAFRDFGRLERADNQGHWLLAIARKKVADAHRKRYRRAEQPISESDLPADDGPSAARLAMRDALAQLPEGQREALTLKYVNGLSTEEVGRVTRRSLAATNSLLQRARQSLRDAFGASNLMTATGEER